MDEASFIIGGGECGDLVRARDWTASRLGPTGTWPQTLRTALAMALTSRFPIAIYWGPEFVMLYNDDLWPLIGANKHPQALGRPAFDVLPEIRELIEPLLRHVRETGDATWSEDLMLPLDRGAGPEESYYTFTYSPIHDESRAVAGVYCVAVETTDKVIEGRRMLQLNALTEAIQAKSPADACGVMASHIARTAQDIPFAMFYLLAADGATAQLAACANIPADDPRAPRTISMTDDSVWPASSVLAGGAAREIAFDAVTYGARGAAVLRIERSGGGTPHGFIVVGLNPHLRSSDSYARFHTLLAASVAQSVGHAATYETERRQREKLYRHFTQAPFPIAVLRGPDHVIELANDRMLRAWGRDDSSIGRPLLAALPEVSDQPFPKLLDDVFRTGVPHVGRAELARLPNGPDGELEDAYFDFAYAPLLDTDGKVEGVLVSAFDVTDAVAARSASERARAAAEAAEQQQRGMREFQERFVAILGHDLRNPIAAITMGAGMLAQQATEPAAVRMAQRIDTSARRVSRMVEQILDLSRIRMGGGIPVTPAEMDLFATLGTIVDELKAAHPARVIVLRGAPMHGHWDRDRLEQVFSNLIGNALHHGLPSAPITVQMREAGDGVCIEVHNLGAPIPASLRDTLFDPFRRGGRDNRDARTAGLGLGLFITHEIVQGHGGQLAVESSPVDGTTFRVTLPRTAAP